MKLFLLDRCKKYWVSKLTNANDKGEISVVNRTPDHFPLISFAPLDRGGYQECKWCTYDRNSNRGEHGGHGCYAVAGGALMFIHAVVQQQMLGKPGLSHLPMVDTATSLLYFWILLDINFNWNCLNPVKKLKRSSGYVTFSWLAFDRHLSNSPSTSVHIMFGKFIASKCL